MSGELLKVSIESDGLIQRLIAIETRTASIPRRVFEDIGTLLIESIHMNFEVGGRPESWIPSKRVLRDGGKTLVLTGALMNSVDFSAIGDNFVEIGAGGGLPYALIHQFGGTIEHPGSDKFQVFEAGGKTVFTHGTKAHQITIQARRYFRIQDGDVEAIKDLLREFIIPEPNTIEII